MKITTTTITLLTTTLLATGGLFGQSTNQNDAAQDLKNANCHIQGAAKNLKDYTFAEKDAFTEAMKNNLAEMNKHIDILDARVNKAGVAAKSELQPKLDALRMKSDQLGKQINTIPTATESTWESVKTDTKDSFRKLKIALGHDREWISKKIGS